MGGSFALYFNGNAVYTTSGGKRQRCFCFGETATQEKGRKGAGKGQETATQFFTTSLGKKETATLFFNTSQMSSVSCLHPHLLHPHEQVAEWACGGGRREQRFCIMSEAAICSRTASRSHGRGGTSPTRFRPYRGRGARIERIFSHIFEYFRIFSNIYTDVTHINRVCETFYTKSRVESRRCPRATGSPYDGMFRLPNLKLWIVHT